MEKDQLFENTIQELRRGVLLLAVLSQLEGDEYGYSLIKNLKSGGLEIDQGTLYPLLRRLEIQGLLSSSWRVEDGRPRRYYTLSLQGRALLPELIKEWHNLVDTVGGLLEK